MIRGIILKSRKFFPLFWAAFSILLSGCGNDEIQLPDKQLEGVINGESWSYKSANAYLASSDFQYRIRFLSSKESVSDPCTLPAPTLTHVKAIFKPAAGSFFVSPHALDDNQVQVSFEISASQNLIAQSGFMEIYAIDNQVIIGYLEASFGEENKVEGSFEIRRCN